MPLSPFTTVLRLHLSSPNDDMESHIKALLRSIVDDTTVMTKHTTYHSLDTLVMSLQDCANAQAPDSLLEFVDNCLLRCSRKPVKYYDDLTTLVSAIKPRMDVEVNDCNIDLLLVTILDQWPFLVKSASIVVIGSATKWLVRYLDLLMASGSNLIVLSTFRDKFMSQVTDKENRSLLEEALREPARYNIELWETKKSVQDKSINLVFQLPQSRSAMPEDSSIAELPVEGEDYSALSKWIQKETPEAIRDGAVGQLILCLCSKHEEIRKQAIIALRNFSRSLEVRFT